VSVILDALRRSRIRRDGSPPSDGPRNVPAALDPGAWSPAVSHPSRARLLALGLLLVIALGVWAVIQVARALIPNDSPATPSSARAQSSSAAPMPRPVTPAAANATRPERAQPALPAAPGTAADPPRQPANPAESPVVLRSAASAQPSRQIAPAPDQRRPDVLKQFQMAVRAQTLGNGDEALTLYRAVLAADSSNVQAHNNLGLLYHRRGSPADAVDQFRRAIAIDPRYVKARSNLAVALMGAGRLSEARAEVRTALAIEPRNADLMVNLALIEDADQHRERAIELLVRAVGVQPTNALAHYNLAVIYDAQGAVARACDHYVAFTEHAGPEHAALVSEVQRRVATLTSAVAPR
jgi:Flp pilus assembly protein TadD